VCLASLCECSYVCSAQQTTADRVFGDVAPGVGALQSWWVGKGMTGNNYSLVLRRYLLSFPAGAKLLAAVNAAVLEGKCREARACLE
jgi:hypothetical protein